jgi:hypothetical protein
MRERESYRIITAIREFSGVCSHLPCITHKLVTKEEVTTYNILIYIKIIFNFNSAVVDYKTNCNITPLDIAHFM